MTGSVERGAASAGSSANDCVNDFRNDSPARASSASTPTPDPRPAGRVTALRRGCDSTVSTASPSLSPDCVWTAARTLPTPPKRPLSDSERKVRLLRRKAVRSVEHGASLVAEAYASSHLEAVFSDEVGTAQGASCTGCIRSARTSDAEGTETLCEVPGNARSARVFPAKAVPSRGRATGAERPSATAPRSDQRVGSVEQPDGCSRCAPRVGAPQGPKDIGERSDANVYGATPSSAVKETTALPKVLWGGGRSRGRRSPSGESPKASRGATTKSVHPSISVEGGEA